mmetsp:Transcript_22651/g.65933  ORF Transcript_22651/g.65933 Transcript_22651/m.65933 type:complete len:200 (+) Transcript_22651:960-1559(+)
MVSSTTRRLDWPTISSKFRYPRAAMCPRTSSARSQKKFITCSGWPENFLRSSGSWVATPTGHVFRWHLRIMMHPRAMSGAVEKPNSSAPRSAAITTSRPFFSWPSVWSFTRDRRSFSTRVCCASATPSSQGSPAPFTPVQAAAPVPPSWPLMVTWSALALATPAATTPTPISDTSFTDTSPWGWEFFRSWISCARSSIE